VKKMEKPKLAITDMDKSIAELASRSRHKTLAVWAADCAARVLPYFEEKYPHDSRPREAIAAGRTWAAGRLKMTDARKAAFAAHAAARAAGQVAAARSAARAAGHAAAAAHVAGHALYAAIYAATAADSAAVERDWQYRHLLALTEKP
jgi:hypothetical protein